MPTATNARVYEALEITGKNTVNDVFTGIDTLVAAKLDVLQAADLSASPLRISRATSYNWDDYPVQVLSTISSTYVELPDPFTFNLTATLLGRRVLHFVNGPSHPLSVVGWQSELKGASYGRFSRQLEPITFDDLGVYLPFSDRRAASPSNVRLDDIDPASRKSYVGRANKILGSLAAFSAILDGQDPKEALAPLLKRFF